jgi:hypothetical protein
MMKTLYRNDLQSADIVWCGMGIRGYTWSNPKLQVIIPPITLLLILIASMADGDDR